MVTLKESILKSVRAGKYAYFPKTKEELVEMIKKEISEKGNNCSLNHINISNIKDLSYLFSCKVKVLCTNKIYGHGLYEFNGDISCWDVKDVKNMCGMFFGSKFTGENGDISGWDVSNVENMDSMFYSDKGFNLDISNWAINDKCDTYRMFSNCPIKEKYKPKRLQK